MRVGAPRSGAAGRAVPLRHLDAADDQRVGPRVVPRRRPPAPTTAAALVELGASRSDHGRDRAHRRRAAAPTPRASIASHRSTIAAARASVPRASAFSSSVSVRTRRARISSISVASNRSPWLSGATAGWSYRMIGDDSTTSVVAVADEHGEGAVVVAARDGRAGVRRADRAARRTRRRRRRAVCAPRRASAHRLVAVARRARTSGGVLDGDRDLEQRAGPSAQLDVDAGRRRRPARARTTRPTAAPTGSRPRRRRAGDARPVDAAPRSRQRAAIRRRGRSRARPPRPTRPQPPSTSSSATGSNSHRRTATLDRAVLHLQEADATSSRASARIDDALGAHRRALRRVGLAARRRDEHAELPAQLVLGAPTPGTGRARSPRTARRRPPRAAPREAVGRAGHRPSSPASFSSCSTCLVPRRQGPRRP